MMCAMYSNAAGDSFCNLYTVSKSGHIILLKPCSPHLSAAQPAFHSDVCQAVNMQAELFAIEKAEVKNRLSSDSGCWTEIRTQVPPKCPKIMYN